LLIYTTRGVFMYRSTCLGNRADFDLL